MKLPSELIKVDGTTKTIEPKDGVSFQFKGEAYDLIGTDMIQIVYTHNDRMLLIDEEGKLKGKPINQLATRLYQYGKHDPIVGDVILCDKEMCK